MARFARSVPAWGGFPTSLSKTPPATLEARASQQITRVDIAAESNKPTKHYSEWHSQWSIMGNLRIRPPRTSAAHFDIQEGQIMFTLRRSNGQTPTETVTAFNLQQMNTYLRKAWEWLDTQLGSLKRRAAAAAAASPAASDPDGLMKYFSLPEQCWGPLFKDTNPALNSKNVFKLMRYGTAMGVLSRCQYSGIMTVPPTNYYTSPTQPQIGKDISTTVTVAGNALVENCFSPTACSQANLFLILKRLPHPRDEHEPGPFAFVPYDTVQDAPPMRERRYNDWSGAVCYGPLIYIGHVIDKRGPAAKTDTVKKIQGMKGSPNEQVKASVGASKMLCYVKRPKGRFWF